MSDYISREAALSFPFANGQYDCCHADEHFIYGCETYREWLEQIPAADVVTWEQLKKAWAIATADVAPVVHGKWIKDRLISTGGGTYGVYRCSVCEHSYQEVGYGFNYCPNCGARMDGGDHDAVD